MIICKIQTAQRPAKKVMNLIVKTINWPNKIRSEQYFTLSSSYLFLSFKHIKPDVVRAVSTRSSTTARARIATSIIRFLYITLVCWALSYWKGSEWNTRRIVRAVLKYRNVNSMFSQMKKAFNEGNTYTKYLSYCFSSYMYRTAKNINTIL